MLSKNTIKHIQSLNIKKYRSINNEFIAEGSTIVKDLLLSKTIAYSNIYITQKFFELNHNFFNENNINIEIVSEDELKKISFLNTPQSIIGIFKIPEINFNIEVIKNELVLMLDNIQDPGNLGTIIRIADWFGINNIICSSNTVDVYNPKVVQSTMGSISRVNIFYEDLENTINFALKNNIQVYATSSNGKSIYESKLSKSGIIIMGNEGNGISESILNLANNHIKIPLFLNSNKETKPESLNVSVATGIICSEFRRD